jgi:energy-coupling factor transporter ATP-binding protein EcfA2
MSDEDQATRITRVEFQNFKAFRRFSVSLERMNVLVGPNNSGKSTILGAFRLLAGGIQRARARKPEWLEGPNGGRFGYRVPQDSMPFSLENVHTDYEDVTSSATFFLSNGRELALHFPREGDCFLFPSKAVDGPAAFKRAFPVRVGIVPVLGPVEHEEARVLEDAVRRGLATHRASRHFRNYWLHYPDGFDDFRRLVRETWPGMDIEQPTQPDPLTDKLAMFCFEDRAALELYWAGFGFQVWCQILTHLVRESGSSLLIVDEPEIYLHPDLQRQLLTLFRDAGPDILLATHSSEMVGEAEPQEILLVDKKRQSAKRVIGVEGTQSALRALGSGQNFTLTQVARTRRVIFVEGDDFKIIRRFAKRMGLGILAGGSGLTPFSLGGFAAPERVGAVSHGVRATLGGPVLLALVFDRDYRSDEEVARIKDELRKHSLSLIHIHSRKEIENYLLVPSAIDRALARSVAEQSIRTGLSPATLEPSAKLLQDITEELKASVQSQYLATRSRFLRGSGLDESTVLRQSLTEFEAAWKHLDTRMAIVPGKEVLQLLNRDTQQRYGVSVTPRTIVDQMHLSEIPRDLKQLLKDLEALRLTDPGM